MSTNHVEGDDRKQGTLLPHSLDEYIDENNPVRFIDAFVDSFDMRKLGFKHAEPKEVGRPSYNPTDILKLLIYGYLNLIRSSRRLERECYRNIELLWLMKSLKPDFKTIADFRKDNIDCIKSVFMEFVYLCKELDLFAGELVSIDGSKFKAVNSKSANFNASKLKDRLRRIEEKTENYLKQIEENDLGSSSSDGGEIISKEGSTENAPSSSLLKEKLECLEQKRNEYTALLQSIANSPQKEVSLTDPDSRLMKNNGKMEVCYNVQTAIDSKNKLIVNYDITNIASDFNFLSTMARSAKETLDVKGRSIEITTDRGYFDSEQIKNCVENEIIPYVPEPQLARVSAKVGVPAPDFYIDRFIYNKENGAYTCPANQKLSFWRWSSKRGKRIRLYRTEACEGCPFRAKCTNNKNGRIVQRWEFEDIIDKMRARLKTEKGLKMIDTRKALSEHPFGTIKRAFNQGYLLLKSLRKVKGEIGFSMLAYNMLRAINILGTKKLMSAVRI